MIGVLAFLVSVAYWPGIAAAGSAPRLALLAVAVPLLFPRKVTITPAHFALFLFLAWSVATLFWTDEPPSHLVSWLGPIPLGGLSAVIHWLIFAGLFCIGANLASLSGVYIGMALGLSLSSAAAIAQMFFGWAFLDQYSVPGGLFINPNFMAEVSVMVLVGLIAERLYWFIPLVLPAALLPQSRSALLALVIALALWTRNRAVMAVMIIGIGVAAIWSIQSGFRLSSVDERIAIWRDTIDGMTWLGRGTGSFYVLYPATASRTNTLFARPDHAHNDVIETFFEAGFPAILLIGVFIFAWRVGRHPSAALVLVAFAVQGLFAFPLHIPASMFLVALVAGHLCADGAALRDYVPDWRVPVRPRIETKQT